MIPRPIPSELVAPGMQRRTFGAPNGDLTDDCIRPVDALIDPAQGTVSVMLTLEPGELEQLAGGQAVWLTMLGGLVPFDARVGRP